MRRPTRETFLKTFDWSGASRDLQRMRKQCDEVVSPSAANLLRNESKLHGGQEQIASDPDLGALNRSEVLRGIKFLEECCAATRPFVAVVESQIARQSANTTRTTPTRAERAATLALAERVVELTTELRTVVQVTDVPSGRSARPSAGMAEQLVQSVDRSAGHLGNRAQIVLDNPRDQTSTIVTTRLLLRLVDAEIEAATQIVQDTIDHAYRMTAMEQQYEDRRAGVQARMDGVSAYLPDWSATIPHYLTAMGDGPAEPGPSTPSGENRPGLDFSL